MKFALLIAAIFTISTTYSQTSSQSDLSKLTTACKDSHSKSLAVSYQDKLLLNHTFEPIDSLAAAHSVLKSIAALAVGRLIQEKKIQSLDEPVYNFYPEWKEGLKKIITIKHLMNHTSGIECENRNDDYFSAPNVVQHALSSDIVDTPGSRFVYNSKAFLLLLGIIGKASGEKTTTYFEQMIFKPLAMSNFKWDLDSVGNVIGLSTDAGDLLKIGQLVLNSGTWKGNQIVSEDWIKQMLIPSQKFSKDCGLLWWLIYDTTHYILDEELLTNFKKAGVKQSFIDKLRLLKGDYINVNIPSENLESVFGKDWQAVLDKELYPYVPSRTRRVYGSKIIGYKAEGYLGQYIIIYPEKGVVAARMIRKTPSYKAETDEFMDFQKLVYELEFIK